MSDKTLKYSLLYRHIEKIHGEQPWGRVLDAGTGRNSLRWISSLNTDQWTEVTGSEGEAKMALEAIGDAFLLKGVVPYREYPLPWVVDQWSQTGFKVAHTKHFNIRYKMLFVNAQLHMSTAGLEHLIDQTLALALNKRAETLRAETSKVIAELGTLEGCRNYAIAVEPIW